MRIMELSMDSEKTPLIETQMEPLTGMNPSDVSDEGSGLDEPEWLCRDTGTMSGTETNVRHQARRKLFIAAAVSVVFMTGEVMGGYLAHSLSIMTDAAHLLTDFGSISISLFSLWVSGRPPTDTMTFGWHRAEILGVLLSVVSIWAVTAVLVLTAIQRIHDGDYEIDSQIMLITSGCAVGVNVLMVLILHQSGSSHGHSHTFPRQHTHGNASVKAAFIHVVGDLLQSAGVLLAAAIIHVWPQYKVADPICTLLFSAVVMATTLVLTKDVFRILMEASPQGVSVRSVRNLLLSVGGVTDVHSLHMWSLNMTQTLLSVHVVTEEDADSQLILKKTTKLLRSEFGFNNITVQMENDRIR